ncbi:MAG: diguanylate cyclase [Helicobacteraceae bacterium]|jgi:diguanylate cyclase (GGDEF)-like protein/PAS domain S-box-containing protein|nr:diguanylate cyclase [Helicobacteraceae bacterium]
MGALRNRFLSAFGIGGKKGAAAKAALALFFDKSPLPVCVTKTNDGSFIAINEAFVKFAKLSEEELLNHSSVKLGVWSDEETRLRFVDNIYASDRNAKFVMNLNIDGDNNRYYEIYSAPISFNLEQAVISCIIDVTDQRLCRSRYEHTLKRLSELADAIGDCYFHCDDRGRFIKLNLAFCALLGYSESELLDSPIDTILSSGHYKRDIESLYAKASEYDYAEPTEQEWIKKDKTAAQMEVSLFVSKDEKGATNGFWGVAREVSAYAKDKKTPDYAVYHDKLTELPNRAWLIDRLYRMIRRSRIAKEKIAILLVDMSRYRLINDAYGYQFGDSLLKEIATLIDSTLRSTDLLARYDGDEFAVVVGAQPVKRSVISVLRRFMNLFDEPIAIGDKRIKLAAHIGVGLFPDDGEDAEPLIKRVEEALKKVSSNEESAFCFISDETNEKIHQRLDLEKALLSAISSGEIIARYQPINEFLPEGAFRMIGLEAFARWLHPTLGELPPNRFMDIAKEIGATADIDRKIYEIALNDLSGWIKRDLPLRITVNLSKSALMDSSFAKWAISLAKSKRINPKLICFDARYGFLLDDEHTIYKTISELCEAGFGFCADDFGEETLFLAKLKKLGINAVKVAPKRLNLIKENEDFNSLHSIELAARSMGLGLEVAGVENEWLDRKVNEAGAAIRQGFLYAQAMSAEEVINYVKGNR